MGKQSAIHIKGRKQHYVKEMFDGAQHRCCPLNLAGTFIRAGIDMAESRRLCRRYERKFYEPLRRALVNSRFHGLIFGG